MKKSIRIPAVEGIPARFASLLVAALAATAVAAGSLPAFAQAGDAAPAAEPVPVAEPAPEPEPKKAEIAKAVTCQVLISQFDDGVAAAKIDDAAKAGARTMRGDGNKACNAWDYDSGIGTLRVALEAIGKKPIR
ncbi:hypothetical protein IGS68_13605 [Skermanella sp. TT6]|uniref:Uncharacterized protein n=1 Tax=Skermanella cutis TaxID=2775420 RepID=A0ABX7BCQ4_9PROT|nr:hypothetical protein [Skermanella sp. TT6]QQP92166.1 hypothetical protein IGS68_13605 [Skermanella sp. TT6]